MYTGKCMYKGIISNLVHRVHAFITAIPLRFGGIKRRVVYFVTGGIIGIVVLAGGIIAFSQWQYRDRITSQVSVGPVAVGNLTRDEAVEKVTLAIRDYRNRWPLTVHDGTTELQVPLSDEAVHYRIEVTVEKALTYAKNFSVSNVLQLTNLSHTPVLIPLDVTINNDWLTTQTASIAAQVNVPSVPPSLELSTNKKSVTVSAGKNGRVLDTESFQAELKTSLHQLILPSSVLPMKNEDVHVSAEQEKAAVDRAMALVSKELVLAITDATGANQHFTIAGPDLMKFVNFSPDFDESLITNYVQGFAQTINRSPKDAKFQFDETSGKVKEFVPAENGLAVMVPETVSEIVQALQKLTQMTTIEPVSVVMNTTTPDVQLAEVNRLGIKERLGVGRSRYQHSIATRVHNVELAASRLNGTLIKPNEEFSFNQAVGEVNGEAGYQPAYVIRQGKTLLDDGGGVCQDSTTVFRAALDAGLPITMRKGHAYRVGYYEQDAKPGLDATVFAPSADLRFLNDTPGYLLIQTEVDSPNRMLTVYLYGTSDGRKAEIKDHVVWDVTPGLPDVYTDDPTLPMGTIKQVDYKAPGTKAKFTYVVTRNNETIIEKTFMTVYQPWASVFLRGTKQ